MKPKDKSTMKSSSTEKAIDRAIHKVYEAYGPNLGAFVSEVQSQLKLEHQAALLRKLKTRRTA